MRSTRGRTVALLVGVVGCLLVPGAVGGARADGPGLVFADHSPARVAWSAVERGAAFSLCNTTSGPLSPGLVITGPDVRVGAGTRPVADLLSARLPVGPIGAGACARVEVTLTDAAATDLPVGESASAQLTAVVPGTGSAGLVLDIVPDAGPALLGPFGEVTLGATRANPWGGAATLDDPTLWLRYAGTPTPIDPSSTVVVDGSRQGALHTLTGQTPVDGGLRIPLSLSGVTRPGTYRGTFELGGDHGSIPVTIVVADAVWVLLLAVLAGVLVALVLRVMTGKWRYRLRLAQARRRVPQRYDEAGAALRPALAERFPSPTGEAVATWQASAKTAARAYFRTVLTVDPTDPTYASLCRDVVEVLADANCLQRTFADAVGDLERALVELGTFLDRTLPSLDDPTVVDAARSLLRLGTTAPPLRLREAGQVTAAARLLTETLDAWRAEAEVILRHMHWSHRLSHGAEFPEQLQLAAADDALGRAVRELFDAPTAAAVASVAKGPDTREAHKLLATVGARRGLWLDADVDGPLRTRVDGTFTDLIPERVAPEELRLLSRSQRWSVAVLPATTFRLAHEYVPVVAGALASVVVTFSGAVVAFVAAAFVAYQALYVGKPFGGWSSVLAAALAGVAAGAVVDALVSGLNWARGSLRTLTS